MNVYQDTLTSPIGNILIKASDDGLTEISMGDNIHILSPQSNDHIVTAQCQLDEYFKGLRDDFDLDYDFTGYTEFYQKVWQELLQVPYGQTKTYKDIAIALGDVKAVRAVGSANGKNPLAIVIPCHRIIGSNGKLIGYAWGMESKKWLLRHELAHSPVPEHMLF